MTTTTLTTNWQTSRLNKRSDGPPKPGTGPGIPTEWSPRDNVIERSSSGRNVLRTKNSTMTPMQNGCGPIKDNAAKRKKVGGGGHNSSETARGRRLSETKRANATRENGGETPSLRAPETYGDAGGFYAGLLGLPLAHPGRLYGQRPRATLCLGFHDCNGHGFRGPSSPGSFCMGRVVPFFL